MPINMKKRTIWKEYSEEESQRGKRRVGNGKKKCGLFSVRWRGIIVPSKIRAQLILSLFVLFPNIPGGGKRGWDKPWGATSSWRATFEGLDGNSDG